MSGGADGRGMAGFPHVVAALALLLGSIEPAPQPPSRAAVERQVPILMYHAVAAPPPHAAWPHLYVAPAELNAHVEWLRLRGYEAVTLSEVWANWHEGRPLPDRPVVLTFDDGHPSHVRHALPILRRHGWPAVLNLKLGNLEPGSFTASDVRRLLDAGWELGAHTFTHPDLRSLAAGALEREVAGSRAAIARLFGVRPAFFCYPAGRYDARVVAAVRAAGYRGATTTAPGLATPDRPFELNRIRVDGGDGIAGLLSALPARTAASPGSAPRAPASGTRA